ncbi:MAG: hypothetical protein GC134_07480 [Proteobacteria bacterium]|nr:hypothetical protein [Pseudomonadota bacterium]
MINFDNLPVKANATWWAIPAEGGQADPDFYALVEYADRSQAYVPFYEATTDLPEGTRRTVALLTFLNIDVDVRYRLFGPDEVTETIEEYTFEAWCEQFWGVEMEGDINGTVQYYEVQGGQWVLVHEFIYETD